MVRSKSPLSTDLVPIKTFRDILVFKMRDGYILVIGCDSSGGIGPKPLDKVKVDGRTLGKFIARVALMEVLAAGARLVCLVNTLSVEPQPTGIEILEGIRDETQSAGLDPDFALTGSSEKNIPVDQTGLGVTVIGLASEDELRIGKSHSGDLIVAIGLPRVGQEVLVGEDQGHVADLQDLFKILSLPFVHEVIPVGSKGIAHEANIIAKSSRLQVTFMKGVNIDLQKSAGPATVILSTIPEDKLNKLKEAVKKPVNLVARLL